jgi:transposase
MLRITDAQWDLIRKHFPEVHIPDDRPGRKPIPARKILDAVMWILNIGAQWRSATRRMTANLADYDRAPVKPDGCAPVIQPASA